MMGGSARRSGGATARLRTVAGILLEDAGHGDRAEACYRDALAADAANVEAARRLAVRLRERGESDEALGLCLRAIEQNPQPAGVHLALAAALRKAGRGEEAATVLGHLAAREPDDPVVAHLLAAQEGRSPASGASPGFIEQVLAAGATGFDEHMARLGYVGPSLVAAAVSEVYPHATGSLDVLDAGCGTGLCGEALRAHAATLTGVDLSPAMLGEAAARGVYDHVVTGDLVAFLGEAAGYDLIVTADTLPYFGELDGLFAAVAAALRPGGFLVFTAEDAGDDPEAAVRGYRLRPSGSYCHSERYVRDGLAAAGLGVVALTRHRLRFEMRRPVVGLVVTAGIGPAVQDR